MKNMFGYLAIVFILITICAFHFHREVVETFTVFFAIVSTWWWVEARIEMRDRTQRMFGSVNKTTILN